MQKKRIGGIFHCSVFFWWHWRRLVRTLMHHACVSLEPTSSCFKYDSLTSWWLWVVVVSVLGAPIFLSNIRAIVWEWFLCCMRQSSLYFSRGHKCTKCQRGYLVGLFNRLVLSSRISQSIQSGGKTMPWPPRVYCILSLKDWWPIMTSRSTGPPYLL